jgi:hypothetical protein
MRHYIFTERERHLILQFLEDKKRNRKVNLLIFRVEEGWQTLLLDIKLLIKLRRLMDAGY